MKRVLTLLLALTLCFSLNFNVYAYDDEWKNAVNVTLGTSAKLVNNDPEDPYFRFTFTAPTTDYYNFTVVNTNRDGKPFITLYDGDENYLGESYYGQKTYTEKCFKGRKYLISVYFLYSSSSADGKFVEFGVYSHEHKLELIDTNCADGYYDGELRYRCSECDYEYRETIPSVKTIKLKQTNYIYDGKAKKPQVIVKDRTGKALKQGVDYEVAYSNNKNIGTGRADVELIGNYGGYDIQNFRIAPKAPALKASKPTQTTAQLSWSAAPKKVNGYEVLFSTSKSFKRSKKVKVNNGKAKRVTVKKLKSNTKYYFKIKALTDETYNDKYIESSWSKPASVKTKPYLKVKTAKLKKNKFNYSGKALKPQPVLKNTKGKTLKLGRDYTLAYKSNKNVGTGTVTVKLKGDYIGVKKLSFCISSNNPSITKLKPDTKSVVVKWKKLPKGVGSYELQYSTKSNFKGAKTVKKKAKSNSCTVKNLSPDTKYYFRVKVYSKQKFNKKTVSSGWSKVKSVKTKQKKKSSGKNSGVSGGSYDYYDDDDDYYYDDDDDGYSGHVYITPTGIRYHYSAACAGKNARETTMDYATRYYTPCHKCVL